MLCQDCKKNIATKKYKTQETRKFGANTTRGYKIHYVCQECWNRLFKINPH